MTPEAVHQFLTTHPIGKVIAAHTGYRPGHPVHDMHHRAAAQRPVAPGQTGPMAPPGASALPPLPLGSPPPMMGGGGMGPGMGPGGPPMPMMAPPGPAGRPPLPPQGAMPQGPPR